MRLLKSPTFIIFLIVFVNFLGYGIVFPILPLLTLQYGGSPLISGALIGVFSLMQVISMPIMGRLSDRYGRRPLLIFSLWGTAISFALMGLTHSLIWLLVARIIDGISGGNLSIAQAYMADITTKKDRASGMGVIAAGLSLGFILGPLWGGAFSSLGLAAPFIAATILTIFSALLAQYFLKESMTRTEISYEKKQFSFQTFIIHTSRSGLLALYIMFLLLFWAQSGVFTILSLFANDVLQLSVFGISLVFAFGGIISTLIQAFAIGKIVKVLGEKKLFIYSAILTIAGLCVMASGGTVPLFFVGITIFSIGNSFIQPLIQAIVSERSSEHEQGGNLGLLQSFGSVGRIFGPVVAGYIYQTVSPFAPAGMGSIIFIIILFLGMSVFA